VARGLEVEGRHPETGRRGEGRRNELREDSVERGARQLGIEQRHQGAHDARGDPVARDEVERGEPGARRVPQPGRQGVVQAPGGCPVGRGVGAHQAGDLGERVRRPQVDRVEPRVPDEERAVGRRVPVARVAVLAGERHERERPRALRVGPGK
jgi:hypothetical protein